jgi:hypothetical protein
VLAHDTVPLFDAALFVTEKFATLKFFLAFLPEALQYELSTFIQPVFKSYCSS